MIRFLIVSLFLIISPFILNGQNSSDLEDLQKKFENTLYQDFKEAENLAIQLKELSAKSTDQNQSVKALLNLARLNLMKKDYTTAKSYIQKIDSIGLDNLSIKNKIDFYNYNAIWENIDLRYDVSYEYAEKAEKLALSLKDSVKIAQSILSKVNIFISQKDMKKSREFLRNSLSYLKDQEDSRLIESAYFIYARTYYTKDLDSALFYFDKSINIAKTNNNLYKQSEAYSDLAFTYVYHYKELNKVEEYLSKSMDLTKQVGHNSILHNNFYIYGVYYETIGDYKAAVKNYKTAIDDYGGFVNSTQLYNAYLMLSSAYYHDNDFKNAIDYQQKFMVLRDSIFNIRKSKEFENIRTQFEVEKKDNQITLLEKENELAATKRSWLISSAVLISAILSGLFLFYRHRARTQYRIRTQEKDLHEKETERLKNEQELKKIQGYIDGQEKEKNRIAIELHDGIASELAGVNHLLYSIDENKNNDKLKTASTQVSQLVNYIRTLSHHLSSHYTQNKSLFELLSELKSSYEHVNEFSIHITIFPPEDFKEITFDLKHQLYRIIQELLKNVQKHAQAENVIISLTKREDIMSLVFEDDGKGFAKEVTAEGIGLQNIKERVANINGILQLDSTLGQGTTIMIEIPS